MALRTRRTWRNLPWFAWAVAAVLTAAGLAVAGLGTLLAVERHADLTLPTPTGPLPVGRTSASWVDPGSFDPRAPDPRTPRELVAWIWYPAAAGQTAVTADYFPVPWQAALREHGSAVMSALTRDAAHVHTHSWQDVAPAAGRYPVVVLRAGASAEVLSYTTLAEDLASHGYVVVGLDAPYRTSVVVFPDGRVVTRRPENNPELYAGDALRQLGEALTADWTTDVGFALDRLDALNRADPSGRLTGHLDLTRVGIMGHSFGGATAADFCRQDARCRAGVDIDGALVGPVIQTGLNRPFLFLTSQMGDFSSAAEVRQIMADLDGVYQRLPADERAFLSIRGANHFTFSDDSALLKSRVLNFLMHVAGVLRIDGRRQLAVTAYAVRVFLDTYLKGEGGRPPVFVSPDYPELQAVR